MGLTHCQNLVPFIPAITLTLIVRRACPAAEKKKGNGRPVGGRGLALFIPMFQSGHSPCLPFLWVGIERKAALGQAKTFLLTFFVSNLRSKLQYS